MTTTNTDHLSLPETLASEPASETDASALSEQPQAAATNNVSKVSPVEAVVVESTPKAAVDDDDDLEEGELKDDDDDSDDDEVDGLGAPMSLQQPTRLLPISGSGGQYGVMQLEGGLAAGQPPGLDGEQAPPKKKRKKRVVRKVKVMKKVIKKVPKKKADQQQQQQQPRQDQQPLLPQQPMLPQNQTSSQPQPFDLNIPSNQPRLLPHIAPSNNSTTSNSLNSNPSVTQAQPTSLLPPTGPQQTTTGNNLDSLLEQQILMLQELQRQQQQQPVPQQQPPPPSQQQQQQQLYNQPSGQQHAEILRAAATDEDLRYLQPPYLFNQPPMNLIQQQDQQQPSPQQQPIQPFISQSNPITLNQPMPFTTSMQSVSSLAPAGMMTTPNLMSTTLANNSMPGQNQAGGMLNSSDGLTPMMQQQLHLISQQNHSLSQQGAPLLPQSQSSQPMQYPNHSTPQPLSQLMPQQQQQHQPPQQHYQQSDTTPSSPDDESGKSSYEAISKMLTMLRNSANLSESSEMNEETQNNPPGDLNESKVLREAQNEVEYSLIPVLVQGIDYTKYKLLSQYEPKIKNDPRLNQQA